MPRVELEPKTSVFERANTLHALDRSATVIGKMSLTYTFYAKSSNRRRVPTLYNRQLPSATYMIPSIHSYFITINHRHPINIVKQLQYM
jgi:hypothetical protein